MSTDESSRIRQLSTSVINKIAAGEVIERPASVVKEILENAVDALAQRIDLDIEQGGTVLIRLTDNGEGIHADDILLTVAPHATSKLKSADDLFNIQTMGFRGEALASIAEVSQFRIRSKQRAEVMGTELEVDAGVIGEPRACGCPDGTQIEVRNLFINTPVRRKYLKNPSTEFGHIAEQFTRISLANPMLQMTLRHNGRVVHELPATTNLRERIESLFDQDLASQLISVEAENNGCRVWGFVGHPSQNKATRKGQYLFLNGRWIQDRSLQHALTEAYRGLVMVGRYPISFLFLELPTDQVDVNVHPTKSEVRFQDSQTLFRLLLSTIRNRFLTMDLDSRLSVKTQAGTASDSAIETQLPAWQQAPEAVQQELVSWVKSELNTQQSPPASQTSQSSQGVDVPDSSTSSNLQSDQESMDRFNALMSGQSEAEDEFQNWNFSGDSLPKSELPTSQNPENAATGRLSQYDDSAIQEMNQSNPAFLESSDSSTLGMSEKHAESGTTLDQQMTNQIPIHQVGIPAHQFPASSQHDVRAMQVHDCYLVVETPEGITLIDQHALHERIMYEQIRTRILSGGIEIQRLLLPLTIQLTAREANLLLDQTELLEELGLQVQDFGGNTIALSGYPTLLKKADPQTLLKDLVDLIESTGKKVERRDLLDSMMHMMSCKAAIKAGQRLSQEEIQALIEQRHLCDDAHHCPHGRPTALKLSKDELDKQFGRLGA